MTKETSITVFQKKLYRNIENSSLENLDCDVHRLLDQLGLPGNLKGYSYLCRAIEMSVVNSEVLIGITKRLYPDLAKEFHTTSCCIERMIRHAIQMMWIKGNKTLYCEIFQYYEIKRPTNSQFISSLAEYFQKKEMQLLR